MGISAASWRQQEFNEAELLWVEMLHSRLRDRRGFSLGIFADALVATALKGSELSPGGTDRYDLSWKGIKVEVKASTRSEWEVRPATGRDSSGRKVRKLWAEVYVLAAHKGDDHREGWEFHVFPRTRFGDHAKQAIRRRHLDDWSSRPVKLRGLPKAVLAASNAGAPE